MKKEKKTEEYQATHEEVCNQALEQYEEMSRETGQWNSIIPEAIKFYRDKNKFFVQEKQKWQEEIRQATIEECIKMFEKLIVKYHDKKEIAPPPLLTMLLELRSLKKSERSAKIK